LIGMLSILFENNKIRNLPRKTQLAIVGHVALRTAPIAAMFARPVLS